MITRFDHCVIGVRDLDTAIATYRGLGFDVQPGGRHTGRGTYNALIRFGVDYLELLSIYDETEAARRPDGLVPLLRAHAGALAGYAVATSDIESDARRFEESGLSAFGPFAMDRLRPDGKRLSWRLLLPGGSAWRHPWPFLIQWDQPDDQRLAWDGIGSHPNGAERVAGVSVVVADLERGTDLYSRQLGLTVGSPEEAAHHGGRRVRVALGGRYVDLVTPTGPGLARDQLDLLGEGLLELEVGVRDLSEARAALASAGISCEPVAGRAGALAIPASAAVGARIVLSQAR